VVTPKFGHLTYFSSEKRPGGQMRALGHLTVQDLTTSSGAQAFSLDGATAETLWGGRYAFALKLRAWFKIPRLSSWLPNQPIFGVQDTVRRLNIRHTHMLRQISRTPRIQKVASRSQNVASGMNQAPIAESRTSK
jgi:hypothetical protein